jgi:hypothetical protein
MQKKERKVWKKNGQVSSREKKRKKEERKRKRINDSTCSLTNIFHVQKRDSFQGAK